MKNFKGCVYVYVYILRCRISWIFFVFIFLRLPETSDAGAACARQEGKSSAKGVASNQGVRTLTWRLNLRVLCPNRLYWKRLTGLESSLPRFLFSFLAIPADMPPRVHTMG